MRADLSINRPGWLYRLDFKKLILVAFLLRFILAAGYDIFVSLSDKESLLPDGRFYSIRGWCTALLLQGHGTAELTEAMVPAGRNNRDIFLDAIASRQGALIPRFDEIGIFTTITAVIYFIFGYFPLAVRVFNIALSIGSIYLLFSIARRQFGEPTASLFLLAALFLPTQVLYSITISRDFIRMFAVSLVLWFFYGGRPWETKSEK